MRDEDGDIHPPNAPRSPSPLGPLFLHNPKCKQKKPKKEGMRRPLDDDESAPSPLYFFAFLSLHATPLRQC